MLLEAFNGGRTCTSQWPWASKTASPAPCSGSEMIAGWHRRAGEPWYIRGLIDRHHDEAAAKGVRIVPTCGYDSIPSDMGAFFIAQHAREKLGK